MHLQEREAINRETENRYLDLAERARARASAGRRQSENSFLRGLLQPIDGRVSAAGLAPAELIRVVMSNRPLMHRVQDALKVLALPSQRPEVAIRAGDWMLRVVPGTGDVGHVSIIASDELLTQSKLASEGIATESKQPGLYGVVIEAGAFPHSRARPFARRLLTSRGQVPPNTVFLRPTLLPPGVAAEVPFDGPDVDAPISEERQNPPLPERCDSEQISVPTTGDDAARFREFERQVMRWVATCVSSGREVELVRGNASLQSVWDSVKTRGGQSVSVQARYQLTQVTGGVRAQAVTFSTPTPPPQPQRPKAVQPQQAPIPSQEPPAPGPLTIDPSGNDADNDIVLILVAIQKPGDVSRYWANEVRPNRTHWAHALSELEQGYIDAMTDPAVPAPLRMRTPVDHQRMTAEEASAARRLFGTSADAARRYANYENRRRILANYVYTHPATVRLQLGLYRLVRDVNPIHFAIERGWQIGSGREMFTGQEVSRLGAAFEFVASLALIYGVGRVLQAARPAAGAARAAPRSLEDPIYDMPADGGGMRINNRWYTEHALERMAPNTPEVRAQIRTRVGQRLERLGITSRHPAYNRVLARALQKIDPRGVPPSVVEAEIARPGSTNVRVVTARRGNVVVTVIRRNSGGAGGADTLRHSAAAGEDLAYDRGALGELIDEVKEDADGGSADEQFVEQAQRARSRIVFYDRETLRYVDGWTRGKGPSAVFLIDRPTYDNIRAEGAKRGREFHRFLAQALAAAGQGRMPSDLMPPLFVIDPTLATVPLNRVSRGDWDDLMIAQLIAAGRRLMIQSETDQWTLINRLFANAKTDAREAAEHQRAAREFAAYFVLDSINGTLSMIEATNVAMQNGHAIIPLGQIRGTNRRFMPGGDAATPAIGDIHTHYLFDPQIDLNRSSVGMTIRSTQKSLHSGVSDVDVSSARDHIIVVYAVNSTSLHRANPDGTKNDQLPRRGNVLREALRVFGHEPEPRSYG